MTTSKRSAKTTVVAKDQETVVIGGIMQERVIESVSKVPILGDIPILGHLFREQSRRKVKTNLLLFLTPYIIRDQRDFLSVLLLAASLASAWLFHRRRALGAAPWVAYVEVTLLVVLFQVFVFLPNQRFKVVLFDLPALLLVGMGAYRLWVERALARYRSRSPLPLPATAVSRTRSS